MPDDFEAQVRAQAGIVEDYPDTDLTALAEGLEASPDAYEDGPDVAVAVAAELRRRARVGVRKWPGPKSVA